ncbi:nascent polypeptide-associated complex subunit alpha, muscle-specific form-like [Rhincodon typus]|uniref:nascent polypeptide-associated complex subunit alpha, muscle-specific form-like n=1 Tax=Rhincodon typus TaxID=259920 RepID=UPI00202EAEF0|nr:nascent polypeptide-associated complex subunit alpha, muscle-specific form-like [Rhincodon typus]
MDTPLTLRRGRRQSEPSKQIQAVIDQSGTQLKYTGSDDDLLSNMETLSLLGSATTLASSVVELEVGAEAKSGESGSPETPHRPSRDEASLERIVQSATEKQEDAEQYEEGPEFCGIGNIDLEMEQIFANMELLQKKTSEGLGAIVEEPSFQLRTVNGDDSLLDVYEDADVEVSEISLLDMAYVNGTEGCETYNSESSEDNDLQRQRRNVNNLESLGEMDQVGRDSQDVGSFANGRLTCEGQRSLLDHEDHHSSHHDSEETLPGREDGFKVNGCPVAMRSESPVQEEFGEEAPSNGHADRLAKPNAAKKDSVQMENDRLLIEKIKNYYESAEMANDQSHLQRRESISFIPTGVVRDSVLWFNYKTAHESIQEAPSEKVPGSDRPSVSAPGAGSEPRSQSRDGQLQLGSVRVLPEPPDGTDPPLSQRPTEAEPEPEFKSSAEILKVWREMEKAAHFCHKHESWNGCGKALDKNKGPPSSRQPGYSEPLLILEDSDLSPSTEFPGASADEVKQDPTDRKPGLKVGLGGKTGPSDNVTYGPWCVGQGTPLCGDIDGCLFQNSEKIMNKVQLLAKMYSQRISRKKAAMPRRIWELEPEARAEYKQWKRRPALKLTRAREVYQEMESDDEVVALQQSAPYAHLVIQDPIPILYAQENIVQLSISKAKSETSNLQLHGTRESSLSRQGTKSTLQAITSQDSSSPTSPQSPKVTSPESLPLRLSAELPSFVQFSSRPHGSSSPNLPASGGGPSLTTGFGAQSPTSESLGHVPHSPLPARATRPGPPPSQTGPRASSPTSGRSSPVSQGSKEHIPSLSRVRYGKQIPVSDWLDVALDRSPPTGTRPTKTQAPPSQTPGDPRPPSALPCNPHELISNPRLVGGVADAENTLQGGCAAKAGSAESPTGLLGGVSVARSLSCPACGAPHEAVLPKPGVSLACAVSEFCCSLPPWVSLRGRSPSPSAIRQLEQSSKPPRGAAPLARPTHTAQPSPSLGPEAKSPCSLQVRAAPPPCLTHSRGPVCPPSSDRRAVIPGDSVESQPVSLSLQLRSPSPFRCQQRHPPRVLDTAGTKQGEDLPKFSNQGPTSFQLCTATGPSVHSLSPRASPPLGQAVSLPATKRCAPSPPLPISRPPFPRGRVNSLPSLGGPTAYNCDKAEQGPSSDSGLGVCLLLSLPVNSQAPPTVSFCSNRPLRGSREQGSFSDGSNSRPQSPVDRTFPEPGQRLRSPSPPSASQIGSSSPHHSTFPTQADRRIRGRHPSENTELAASPQASSTLCSSAANPELSVSPQPHVAPRRQPPARCETPKDPACSNRAHSDGLPPSAGLLQASPGATTPNSAPISPRRRHSVGVLSPMPFPSPRVRSPVPVMGVSSTSPERPTSRCPSPSPSQTSSRSGSPIPLWVGLQGQSPILPSSSGPLCQSPTVMSAPFSPPTPSSPGRWAHRSVTQQMGNSSCLGIKGQWSGPLGESVGKGCARERLDHEEHPGRQPEVGGFTGDPSSEELVMAIAGPPSVTATGGSPCCQETEREEEEDGETLTRGGSARPPSANPASGQVEWCNIPRPGRSTSEASAGREKGNMKTSYSTTVNLQIGGTGKRATFSRAQVSLTQMFLPAAGQSVRKVSGSSGMTQTT